MAACDGKTYLQRIASLNAEIWINGAPIKGDICEHPAFKGVLQAKAKLYDLQVQENMASFMTFTSPLSGKPVGTSFLEPKSKDDLEKRRLATETWARTSGGLMGRSPDYMNTGLMSLGAAWDTFEEKRPFGRHIRTIYERAREKDLSFCHTFVSPQVNRSTAYFETGTEPIAARIVKSDKDGLTIKGARLLATQGGITDELLVLPVGGNFINESYVYAFSIPTNTKNLRFICRESFAYRPSSFDHPLGSRFEEMDTIVVFDNVFIPWENVFLFQNYQVADRMYTESQFYPFLLHQTVARQTVKTQFLLGIAQMIVNHIDIGSHLHVKEKVSEIITGYETMKALLISSETGAKANGRGIMVPDSNPLYAAIVTYPRLYPRLTEIIQLLGASGLISIPTEADFESPVREDLDLYLQSTLSDGYDRTKLFRLAWDISISAFAGRQTLYERYFFGDPVRLHTSIYNSYERDDALELAKEMLAGK